MDGAMAWKWVIHFFDKLPTCKKYTQDNVIPTRKSFIRIPLAESTKQEVLLDVKKYENGKNISILVNKMVQKLFTTK